MSMSGAAGAKKNNLPEKGCRSCPGEECPAKLYLAGAA
jgi:hypothetical protein